MFDKQLIAQLSSEIQERINLQMETGKMDRMQKFATDGKIDSANLMAFALSEAKLYTTLYTTDFLMTLAEYEEMDQKMKDGTLELPEIDKDEADDLPLQMEADWDLVKAGDAPPPNLQIEEVDPFHRSHTAEEVRQREAEMEARKHHNEE